MAKKLGVWEQWWWEVGRREFSNKPGGQRSPQWNVNFEPRIEQGIMADVGSKFCIHLSKFRQFLFDTCTIFSSLDCYIHSVVQPKSTKITCIILK